LNKMERAVGQNRYMATSPQFPPVAEKNIRVLIVDDSVVMRRLIAGALAGETGIEVAGTAANGSIALQKIPQLNPDIVTLDIEMPEMDGLETLRRIRASYPGLRVVMCSNFTDRGAAITLEALASGANDYVTKRSDSGSMADGMGLLRRDLVAKIRQFFPAVPTGKMDRDRAGIGTPRADPYLRNPSRAERQIVAIGVSTGGPSALAELVSSLPPDFPLPVLIVQHMPPLFTKLLAGRLDANSRLRVHEAADGCPIERGHIYIAPGDYHMIATKGTAGMQIKLHQGAPENSCRPAVDALFRSLADAYGAGAIAVVLTGMGQDGLRGVRALKEKGAFVLAQDEASSVVWGMPGFVAKAGLADKIVPLKRIAPEMLLEIASSRLQQKLNGQT
jgi:two-component system, chemotaxis family, protein-glutamate methylesterase/glutaminase